jgi:16S rRNA (cytosine1402-N4)-methyltransferase
MLKECLEALALRENSVVIDATCGEGGHSEAIAARIPGGTLLCVDRNAAVLARARERLAAYPHVRFFEGTYDRLSEALAREGLKQADAILADLGISLFHYREEEEGSIIGFSYTDLRGLDMRLDDSGESAYDVVNRWRENDLADLLYRYGEETESRRIARMIVSARPVKNAKQLSDIVMRAKKRRKGRLHPATQTFQALRIHANRELEVLESFLPEAVSVLREGGRLAVMSYHSLEDRIVKQAMRAIAVSGEGRILTKKPIVSSEEEVRANRPSRSAKLRILEKGSIGDESFGDAVL